MPKKGSGVHHHPHHRHHHHHGVKKKSRRTKVYRAKGGFKTLEPAFRHRTMSLKRLYPKAMGFTNVKDEPTVTVEVNTK